MCKRIIPLILIISMLFVLGAAPAYADAGDAVSYSTECFWTWLKDIGGAVAGGGGWSASDWWKALISADNPEQSYSTTISSLPVSSVGSDGALYWHPNWTDFDTSGGLLHVQATSDYDYTMNNVDSLTRGVPSYYAHTITRCGNIYTLLSSKPTDSTMGRIISAAVSCACKLTAPISGSYSCSSLAVLCSYTNGSVYYTEGTSSHNQGDLFYGPSAVLSCQATTADNVYVYFYAPVFCIVPSTGTINTQTDTNYNINTRVNNNTFNIATASDGSGTYKAGVQFVNETTNKYYSVENNTSYDISSWKYNYVTRTYDLTLSDASTVSVAFGDNYITVTEQGTTHNYYYAVENTPSPTPAPTATPAPTPTPDPTDSNGWWSWLKTWLTDFKTWLGNKLDALTGGDSSNTNIDVDNDSHDFTVTFKDSNDNTQNFSLKSFKSKFSFLKDIYTIGSTLISEVSEDSDLASQYSFNVFDDTAASPSPSVSPSTDASSNTMVAAAAVDGALAASDDSTTDSSAITGSSSVAPSITIDFSKAHSCYGYDYGGESKVLDLSWYTPYKTTVDNIAGGFLWLLFMWGLFKNAPNFLAGMGIVSNHAEDISAGSKNGRWWFK